MTIKVLKKSKFRYDLKYKMLGQSLKFLSWYSFYPSVWEYGWSLPFGSPPPELLAFSQTGFGSRLCFCSHSPSVHIFSLISLQIPTSVSQPVPLWHLLSCYLSGSCWSAAFCCLTHLASCWLLPNAAQALSLLVLLHCLASLFSGVGSWGELAINLK